MPSAKRARSSWKARAGGSAARSTSSRSTRGTWRGATGGSAGRGRELGRLGHVPPAPDDDRIAALDLRALQIRVGDLAREEADAVLGLVGAALDAHRTAIPALELVELGWPLHGRRR